MDFQIFFEQFINGITQGSVYALLALGFTMIFGTLRMVTFAHGEVYMIGAYVGFEMIRLLYPSFLIGLAAALIATALLGIIIEILAFHFLRDAPHATSLLVTIGISIVLAKGIRPNFRFHWPRLKLLRRTTLSLQRATGLLIHGAIRFSLLRVTVLG